MPPRASPLAAPFFLDDAALEEDISDAPNQWAWSLSSKYADAGDQVPLTHFEGVASELADETDGQRGPVRTQYGPKSTELIARRRAASARPSTTTHADASPTSSQPSGRQGGIGWGVLVSGKHSAAIGSGLHTAVAGSATAFIVHGYDRVGRPILPVGLLASVLDVKFSGPSKVEHKCESQPDGSVRVWYTPPVSGSYSLRVGVRASIEATRIEPIAGSPFALEVSAAKMGTPRGASRSKGAGGAEGGHSGHGGSAHSPRSPGRLASPQASIKAADIRLRAPRGLLANASAGVPARLELLAPLMGSGKIELPGRMRIVLHLQSAWCDPHGEEGADDANDSRADSAGSRADSRAHLDGIASAGGHVDGGGGDGSGGKGGGGRVKGSSARYFHGHA